MKIRSSVLRQIPQKVYGFLDARIEKIINFFNGRLVADPVVEPEFLAQKPDGAKTNITVDSICDLLNGINRTFKDLSYKDININLPGDSIRALKKIGPTVIMDSTDHFQLNKNKINEKQLPSIVFMATNFDRTVTEERINMSLFCAIKAKRKPRACARIPGTIYEIGFSYGDSKKRKRLWFSFYVSVLSGELTIVEKIPYTKTEITPSRKGRIPAHIRHNVFGRQPFISEIINDRNFEGDSPETIIANVESRCAMFFSIWQQRKEFWRVAVKKRNKRMTFLIKQKDPKILFKDRRVAALTKTGQKKRIIHYVAGHLRTTKGKTIWVNEHLRGIRTFMWGGNECSILAPNFHKLNMDNYTTGADFFDEDEKLKNESEYMTMSDFANAIIKAEDAVEIKESEVPF